jgi:16S rRNA (uracil1498-N3)-methyltransferase
MSEGDDVKILFYENEKGTNFFPGPGDAGTASPPKVMVLLGPEGGFAEEEVAAARAAGFSVLSMGPRILKAETAAVAACTLIQYVYGDMGGAGG